MEELPGGTIQHNKAPAIGKVCSHFNTAVLTAGLWQEKHLVLRQGHYLIMSCEVITAGHLQATAYNIIYI